MKAVFSKGIYEIATILLLVGHLFWNLSMVIHLGNIMAIIPTIILLITYYLVYAHHPKLSLWMKVWASYLLISGAVAFGSKLILGISRDQYPEGIEWKALIIITGILVWWLASSKVQLIPSETKDNF